MKKPMKPTLTAINLQALEAGLTEGHRLAAATHAAPETIGQIIERLRLLTEDHGGSDWPAVRMRDITALIAHIDGHHSEQPLDMATLKGQRMVLCSLLGECRPVIDALLQLPGDDKTDAELNDLAGRIEAALKAIADDLAKGGES